MKNIKKQHIQILHTIGTLSVTSTENIFLTPLNNVVKTEQPVFIGDNLNINIQLYGRSKENDFLSASEKSSPDRPSILTQA